MSRYDLPQRIELVHDTAGDCMPPGWYVTAIGKNGLPLEGSYGPYPRKSAAVRAGRGVLAAAVKLAAKHGVPYWPSMVITARNPASWSPIMRRQKISSAKTSGARMAATFKALTWTPGTINADIGGGRYNLATRWLARRGVRNVIFDPPTRSLRHNLAAIKLIAGGKAHTATVNNVLNVIREAASRRNVILQAADAVGRRGTAWFLIYEGDGSGRGAVTTQGWQENRRADTYLSEIDGVFKTVIRHGRLIEARL